MSSTDLTLDEQDIHFLLKDWLNVSRLSQYDSFKDFDQETIEMLVEEGFRFAKDVVAPSRADFQSSTLSAHNSPVRLVSTSISK